MQKSNSGAIISGGTIQKHFQSREGHSCRPLYGIHGPEPWRRDRIGTCVFLRLRLRDESILFPSQQVGQGLAQCVPLIH